MSININKLIANLKRQEAERLAWKNKLNTSIEVGSAEENRLKSCLENMGFYVQKSEGECIGWDLQVTNRENGNAKKLEVKTDLKSAETGRVAVELHKMVGREAVNSGLSATDSDYYIYTFPGDDNFYIVSVPQLNIIYEDNWHQIVIECGDWRNVNMLIDKEVFLRFCKVITLQEMNKILR